VTLPTTIPLPFFRCRFAVVKFRCSVKITLENSVPLGIEIRNGSGNRNGNAVRKRQRLTGTAKWQWNNGNGMVETDIIQ